MTLSNFVPWLFSRKQKPLVTLAVSGSRGDPQLLEIEFLPAMIGRSSQADVCLLDRWVSKVHCWLEVDNGRLMLYDAGSTHGTMVNGDFKAECALEIGDKIVVGATRIEVVEIAAGDCSVTLGGKDHVQRN